MVVNCVWNNWKEGTCSVTCGKGTRTCTRTKKVQEKCGGKCVGGPTQVLACNKKKCPSKFFPQ